MHHLRLLGTIDLRDSAGHEVRAVLQQPKRLALLAWFALEVGEHFVRRDTVLALFWPDLDQSNARAALRRALYFLRKALGDGIIEGRGDEELRLGKNLLSCDATDCRAALKRGDAAEARRLYGGELLAGFFIAGAGPAEEWLDQLRRTLSEQMLRLAPPAPSPPVPVLAPATPHAIVAVMPFVVHADARLRYLSEGLMDLLRVSLDGVRHYRTLDPRAARTPATHTVTGTLVEAGGRFRITAQLRDRNALIVAQAESQESDEPGLLTLIDGIVRQLVIDPDAGPPDRLMRLANQTTESWPALRAWLSGEHEFRLGHTLSAFEAYHRSAALDPTFALAYYRLAAVCAVLAQIDTARTASSLAMIHRNRLTHRDQLLVEAQNAWLHGSVDEAERRYGSIVATHPDDVEAWSLLGDLLLHHNPYRGASIRAARDPLQQALRRDPQHLSTLGKLARLDALEQRGEVLHARVREISRLSPDGERANGMRLLLSVITGDRHEEEARTMQLREAPAMTLGIAFSDVALYAGDPEAAFRIGQQLLGWIRAPELQAYGMLVLAGIAAGQRRFDAARGLLQRATDIDFGWGITVHGILAALPFLNWPEAEVIATRGAVLAWDPAAGRRNVSEPMSLHNELRHHARAWVLGLLSARLGDRTGLAAALETLTEIDTPPEHAVLAQRLERSLGAEMRVLRGDPQGALDLLSAAPGDLWFQYAVASPLYSGAFDRWRRATLLQQLGRGEEAKGWFESLVERSPWELPFRAATSPSGTPLPLHS